jgi:Family of unknown function (DUF6455)
MSRHSKRYSKMDHHAELVGDMARVRGVDIGEAMLDGRLSAESYRNAVRRCMSCDSPEACAVWLSEHASGADAAPEYCRNGRLLERLANG